MVYKVCFVGYYKEVPEGFNRIDLIFASRNYNGVFHYLAKLGFATEVGFEY